MLHRVSILYIYTYQLCNHKIPQVYFCTYYYDGIINYSVGISWAYGPRRTTMPHPHASARAFAAAREWISCAVRRSQLGWGCEPYWIPSQLVGTQARRSMYYIYIYILYTYMFGIFHIVVDFVIKGFCHFPKNRFQYANKYHLEISAQALAAF